MRFDSRYLVAPAMISMLTLVCHATSLSNEEEDIGSIEARLRERYQAFASNQEIVMTSECNMIQFNTRETVNYVEREPQFFVVLLSNNVNSKTDSYVAMSRNPALDACLHNACRSTDKSTHNAAPHWRIDLVLGPFRLLSMARDCGQNLVFDSRGKRSKRKKAHFLAEFYNVNLYDSRLPWPEEHEPFSDYLARHAPAPFNEVYQELCQ